MNKTNVNKSANWQGYEKHAPWLTVTSRELSGIMNVSLQTINNWKMRGLLPAPETDPKHAGNVNRYRISAIRSWIENKSEEQIQWEWIKEHLDLGKPFDTIEQAKHIVIIGYDILGLQKP